MTLVTNDINNPANWGTTAGQSMLTGPPGTFTPSDAAGLTAADNSIISQIDALIIGQGTVNDINYDKIGGQAVTSDTNANMTIVTAVNGVNSTVTNVTSGASTVVNTVGAIPGNIIKGAQDTVGNISKTITTTSDDAAKTTSNLVYIVFGLGVLAVIGILYALFIKGRK